MILNNIYSDMAKYEGDSVFYQLNVPLWKYIGITQIFHIRPRCVFKILTTNQTLIRDAA